MMPASDVSPGDSGFGILIVLEGLDGAGTTTQSSRLIDWLRERGRPCHLTREPSDGPIGRLIREMLTGQHAIPGLSIDPATLGLLFAADRADHLQREVGPRLAAGDVVVSDRWYHSTYAYQADAESLPWLTLINGRARRPDLTIFLDVSAEVAADRRHLRGDVPELFDDLRTQQRVARMYALIVERMAGGEPGESERIESIDGERSPDWIARAVRSIVDPLLLMR